MAGTGVLVIDEDPAIGRLLGLILKQEGFEVEVTTSGNGGLDRFQAGRHAAVILECRLPDWDGFALCREVRSRANFKNTPLILMSAVPDDCHRYEAFASGAIDFIAKPFDVMELLWRLRAHIRHAQLPNGADSCRAGSWLLDLRNHQLSAQGRSVSVTPSECAILRLLIEESGRAVSIEHLLTKALGYPPQGGNPEVVRTHIRNLRYKLEDDPKQPKHLVNLPRIGYLLAGC